MQYAERGENRQRQSVSPPLDSGGRSPGDYDGPATSPSSRAQYQRSGTPRSNKKYTTEQTDWISYHKYDKNLPWDKVNAMYRQTFPEDVGRGNSGLQAVYYRLNLSMPLLDPAGNLVPSEDDPDEFATQELKLRRQGTKIGLLYRYPDRAVSYDWVDDEDKSKVWELGAFDPIVLNE